MTVRFEVEVLACVHDFELGPRPGAGYRSFVVDV
jgi:hypothetical protein